MPAELAVVVASTDAALAIPRAALLGDFGSEFVFVEEDAERGLFKRVAVVRGLADDQLVEIVEGLLPGDRVVTVGNYSLQFVPPYEEPAPADASESHAESNAPDHSNGSWRLVGTALLVVAAAVVVFVRRRTRLGQV
jgi:hypothetical protein